MSQSLDQVWPKADLEDVRRCPYCASENRTVAYSNVQDWSFNCASGKWTYWDCTNCHSLYLDPRPTLATIGSAYDKYYTHGGVASVFSLQAFKSRLKNECLSYKLKANLLPRLHLPSLFNGFVKYVGSFVHPPFGWILLSDWQKGRLMDIGCGDGRTVAWARLQGWDAMGIEIDPAAARYAQKLGLNVLEETYEKLSDYHQTFDCIVCSHVLEHVHTPLDLVHRIKQALKPGGKLILTLPNAQSALRHHFGIDWRGLEAPRHIAIPSQTQLRALLTQAGFLVDYHADNYLATAVESYRIRRRGKLISPRDLTMARQLNIVPLNTPNGNDFIKFVCTLPADVPPESAPIDRSSD